MVESFLEKFQVDHPSVQGEAARDALRQMYDQVASASLRVGRTTTTFEIFASMKTRLVADLEMIQAGKMSPEFIAVMKDDPATALFNFLNGVYSNILEHVCHIGGIPYINSAPAAPPPQEAGKEDELSAADQLLLDTSKCGLA